MKWDPKKVGDIFKVLGVRCVYLKYIHPLKPTNMAHANRRLEKEISIGNHHFLGFTLVFGRETYRFNKGSLNYLTLFKLNLQYLPNG